MTPLLASCAKSFNPDCLHGQGRPLPPFEIATVLHAPPVDAEFPDIVPARVAASLQAGFEREYRDARRDKIRFARERKRQDDMKPARPRFTEGR